MCGGGGGCIGHRSTGTGSGGSASAAEPGDGARFDTWAGYQVGRNPVEALVGDFNSDGAPDVAWVRNDFFDNTLSYLTFTAPAGPTFSADFDAYIQPPSQLSEGADVVLMVEDRPLLTVSYTTWLVP